jgi:molybdenum cofactor cytidylyltransferase
MKFGEVALDAAEGGVLAHSVRLPDGALRKGHVLDAGAVARLAAAGFRSVVVARLEAGDVGENEAAAAVARALSGKDVRVGGATTGRVNLHAGSAGLLQLDVRRIEAANSVHEGLTMATLPPDSVVGAGQMIATIKIIPYSVPGTALEQVLGSLQGVAPAVSVAHWAGVRVQLVMTRLVDTSAGVLAKMRRAVLQRLEPLEATLAGEQVVAHQAGPIAGALATALAAEPAPDLLLVSGIAATVDRSDVVPDGIVQAGGRVLHAGMPVDPGNLLLLAEFGANGSRGAVPVVGIPTCARSPRLNGFDFVLRRFSARLPVSRAQIMAMGVGGLLSEIESRPMPREAGDRD